MPLSKAAQQKLFAIKQAQNFQEQNPKFVLFQAIYQELPSIISSELGQQIINRIDDCCATEVPEFRKHNLKREDYYPFTGDKIKAKDKIPTAIRVKKITEEERNTFAVFSDPQELKKLKEPNLVRLYFLHIQPWLLIPEGAIQRDWDHASLEQLAQIVNTIFDDLERRKKAVIGFCVKEEKRAIEAKDGDFPGRDALYKKTMESSGLEFIFMDLSQERVLAQIQQWIKLRDLVNLQPNLELSEAALEIIKHGFKAKLSAQEISDQLRVIQPQLQI